MAYIGNSPANVGNYQVVDDISGSFNGTTTSFALTASSLAITPVKSGQLLVSINGVLQEPDDTGTDGFKVSGSNIVFSSAPASGSTFWCVYQGQNVDIGTPSDGTVGTAQMSSSELELTGNLSLGDNVKATFGASDDLQIYHDGNSWIKDEGTGYLGITTNGTAIYLQKGTSETLAEFGVDGACKFRYDNSQKLVTTNTGIDVTGSVTCDGLVSSGNMDITKNSPVFKVAESGGGDVRMSATGSTGHFGTYSNVPLVINTNSTERMRIDSSGNVGIGTSSPSSKLDVNSSSSRITSKSLTITFSTGSAVKNIATISNYNTWTMAVASMTFTNIYAWAGTGLFTGTRQAATRRGSNNTVWVEENNVVLAGTGTSASASTLYWEDGVLKTLNPSSNVGLATVTITYDGCTITANQ